jgi:hypothetical protein
MLNFFIILLTNIFTGVIIYLVLTIRLEKKSSSYEQEKLKREFDEVIRDFNSSAERNISILENRIAIMKKLLNISGKLPSIDIEVLEKELPYKREKKDKPYSIVKDFPGEKKESSYSFIVDEKIEMHADATIESETENRESIYQRYNSSKQKHETLVELYTEGHTLETLSATTGIPSAEIELILNLNGIETGEQKQPHGF